MITILIPRHIERSFDIKKDLESLNLNVQLHEPKTKIDPDMDIYLVNSYGKTKTFFNLCKNVFLGGSLINHGGQNPLEAARYGCNIIHGPNIQNFSEIYNFLKKNNISRRINSPKKMASVLNKLLKKKSNSKKIQLKLKFIGKQILDTTYKEIKI